MQYIFSEQSRIVSTSVRELCEFLYKSGNVYSGGVDITSAAMTRGAKIHKQLQALKMKENPLYECEYRVKCFEEIDGFEYEIGGFIDGLLPMGDGTVIDEFKTTSKDLDELEWDTVKAYCAQIMCYGYMYMAENGLNFITLCLTYYNYDSDGTKTIEKEFTFTELRKWFEGMLRDHVKWARLVYDHKMKRNASLQSLRFPFPEYRSGQRELSAKIYRTNRSGKRLFAQAPTGIGKTVSTLFPSLKAIGEGEGDKIFYLSAKNSGSEAAKNALSMFYARAAVIKYITITSKEKICPEDKNCLPSECEYSKGHYDRVNEALFELVSNEYEIDRDVIMKYAEKYTVCPFELSLDVSEFCDAVVGDYNYAFDPRAKLQRYFGGEGGDYICLVDEAHNLVDRARDMYSAQIDMLFLKRFYGEFKTKRGLKGRLTSCIKVLEKYRDKMAIDERDKSKIEFSENDIKPFRVFCEDYRKFLSEDEDDDIKKATLELYFEMSFFVEIFDTETVFQQCYIDLCETEQCNTKITLFCADPSEQIRMACKKMRSTTFFSATMTPDEYYKTMLGYDKDEDEIIDVPSPFPKENFYLGICKNVSTKLKNRQSSLETVLEIIYNAVSERTGNYFVFFPSYGYMNDVYEEFCTTYPNIKTIVQTSEMSQEDRDRYLSNFEHNPTQTLVAFAVCGGVFSEGVDLTGDRLSGAIIVGTGFPAFSFEKDMLKEHFDKTIGEGLGVNYAYTYTGLNKVYQAGGRVIRTGEDKGFVLLVDERYSKISHRRTFPSAWKNINMLTSPEAVKREIARFWGNL